MRLLDRLRGVDDRLVPRLAAGLRAVLNRLPGRRPSRVPGLLRRLDARLPARGPLGRLRDTPQLGLLAVAAVLLAGIATAVARAPVDPTLTAGGSTAGGPRTAPVVPGDEPLGRLLGPAPGTAVEDYRGQVRARMDALATRDPDGSYVALVSLVQPLAPGAAQVLASGLEARRVYLRALPDAFDDDDAESADAGGDSQVLTVVVTELAADLAAAYTAEGGRAAGRVAALRTAADSTDPDDAVQRARALAAVRQAQRQAEGWDQDCRCVVGFLLEAPAALLADLQENGSVRAVEPAAPGADPDALEVQLLLPEVKGTVADAVRPSR